MGDEMARKGYRKIQASNEWEWDLKSLSGAFLVSCLALWAVFTYSSYELGKVNLPGPPGGKQEKTEFSLGGIRFGMTPETVRRLNPSFSLGKASAGNQTGTFISSSGGVYKVSFLDARGGRKAFRLRFDRSYDNFDENDLIFKISEKFGRPATSNCYNSSFTGSKECRFSWLVAGISLKAVISHFIIRGKKGRTTLMLIAVDTLIEGRRLRSLRGPSKDQAAYRLKKGAPLPF